MYIKHSFILLLFFLETSCQKYLNKIPDKSLTIPTTVDDLTGLLNNNLLTNNNPAMPEFGTDDYYFSYTTFQSQSVQVRNCYTWQPDIFEGSASYDWEYPYVQIYNANVVLDNLNNITLTTANLSDYNELKGRALFLRAFAYYNLSQEFIKPYDSTSADKDLGLPLRLSSDANDNVGRSTVQQTYQQMIKDLSEAKDLLSAIVTSKTPNIPNKPAAMALLSRIYLNMGNYTHALSYADSALSIYPALINYNQIDTTPVLDFPYPSNNEVLFQADQSFYFWFALPTTIVDSTLYKSYGSNDLRKAVFYYLDKRSGNPYFRGSYTGNYFLFGGLATDELYLTAAECLARLGKTAQAMNKLNVLLETRYKTGTYIPMTASNADNALKIIIGERRKELAFRGIRWTDLRRLNKDPRFATTLKRLLNGKVYTLVPNDPKYVFPLPDDEVELTGEHQNKR
jgi:tetratricopeptide (TPR) repeat protein